MIVVDTDILCAFLIREVRTVKAQQLRELDPVWRAPQLWRSEFISVLNKYRRAKIMNLDQAQAVLQEALRLYADLDAEVDLSLALKLAAETGASTYDAHFLALAHQCGCPLVTGEKRHPGAALGLALNLDDYLKA